MTPRQLGLLGALAALWGASYLLIKYALEDLGPAVVVFGRTALAAAVLYAVIRARDPEARRALGDVRRRPWLALGLGAVAIAAPFLLITIGEQHVNSGLTAVLITPSSLFVGLFAPFIDTSETMSREQALGLVVGLVGVALLVGVEAVGSLGEFLGALAVVGASIAYALSTFVVKRGYRGMPTIAVSLISVGMGSLLSAPAALATLPGHVPGVRALLAVAALGVAGTALAFVIFYRLIAEVGAGRASLVSYLVPPISLAYGALLLGERITIVAIGGLALICAGVALASRRRGGGPEDRAPAPAAAAACDVDAGS